MFFFFEIFSVSNPAYDDIDDDDNQVNSPNKVITSTQQSTTSVRSNSSNFDALKTIKTDVQTLLKTSIPQDYTGFVQCHIKREKEGLTKKFSLYFDGQNANEQVNLIYVFFFSFK